MQAGPILKSELYSDACDLFLSYCWPKEDEEDEEDVMGSDGRLTKKVVEGMDSYRVWTIAAFPAGHISQRPLSHPCAGPRGSADALKRMRTHDATQVDYTLLEWVMRLLCIFPVAVLERLLTVVKGVASKCVLSYRSTVWLCETAATSVCKAQACNREYLPSCPRR